MVASLRRSSLLLATLLGAACAAEPLAPTTGQISDYLTGVSARDGQITAVLRDSAPPGASFGPSARVSTSGPVKHGESAKISLTGGAAFTRVYVSTPMAGGCWDITLPGGVMAEDLVLSVSPKLRPGRLKVRYTLEGPSGVGGAVEELLDVGN